jgi:hypothetical protein
VNIVTNVVEGDRASHVPYYIGPLARAKRHNLVFTRGRQRHTIQCHEPSEQAFYLHGNDAIRRGVD